MPKFQKLVLWVLCIALLVPFFALSSVAEAPSLPSVSAKAAVLMEVESGDVVYAKNENDRLPMASTTKIVTALTAARLAAPDTLITVDAQAVGVEGSSIYLVEGETLTLEQLLYALLLESANDAAVAIAIGLCGSMEAFANEMNRVAEELELKNTHFMNPHGLDDDEHYTTAYELAILAKALLENEWLTEIVSTKKTTIPHGDKPDARLLVNHNKLLRSYDGCIGMKTGFTKKSGRCLVSAAERDGVRMIAVTLNAPDDWQDHTQMLDYGFTQYRSVLLCAKEAYQIDHPVVGGTSSTVLLCNPDELRAVIPINCSPIEAVVELSRFSYAPVNVGTQMGQVVFYADINGDGVREALGSCALIACQSVAKSNQKLGFWQWLKNLFAGWFSD